VYAKTAQYYDAIYAALGKDYARESDRLRRIIEHHKRSPGHALLDVACGTGGHIDHLKRHYAVEGLDVDADMLRVARRRHPDVAFHQADMTDFHLGRQFDVIVCLFSAIAYTHTAPRLCQMLRVAAEHLYPGGVFAAEPFIAPERWRDGLVHADFVDQPDLKLARMNISRREGHLAVLDFHFLVATASGVEYFTERHDLALFTHEEYLDAFRLAGLEVHHDPDGLMGRGLYIGLRPGDARERI
jgi:SAM-dependent methyltransferase